MATRSTITAKLSDGTWKSVYCHFDGYPEHNGKILLDHYSTQERVDALLAHGDMSVLAARCDKPEGHSFSRPVEGVTIYYGRDRGEEGAEGQTGTTEDEARRDAEEFNYTWDGERWTVDIQDKSHSLASGRDDDGYLIWPPTQGTPTMTPTFNEASLVSKALATLLTRIVDGKYGDALPPQDALALDLKVSRTVLREALVILRFCNVLTIRPKTGTKINDRAVWKSVILDLVEVAA